MPKINVNKCNNLIYKHESNWNDCKKFIDVVPWSDSNDHKDDRSDFYDYKDWVGKNDSIIDYFRSIIEFTKTELLKVQKELNQYRNKEKIAKEEKKEEEKLRNAYPTLKEAWNNYQLALKLIKGYDKN